MYYCCTVCTGGMQHNHLDCQSPFSKVTQRTYDYRGTQEMSDGLKDSLTNLSVKEGVKHDNGKPGMSLLPSKPLQEIAKVLDYGATKYSSHNWRKGINFSRVYSALQRHLGAWNEGQDLDEETKLNHLAHAACNILFLLEYQLSDKAEFDDRYKPE